MSRTIAETQGDFRHGRGSEVVLALGRAQTTADRLDEQDAALGRPGVDDAADVKSTPVVRTPTLQMMRVSPARKRSNTASRSSRAVVPSMYSAATPTSTNRSATCWACLRLTQKTKVGRFSPRLSQVSTMSPVMNRAVHRLGKFALVEIAGDRRDDDRSGCSARRRRNRRESRPGSIRPLSPR